MPGISDELDVLQDSVLQQSRSVEGIWQGLKVIEEEDDPEMFERAPRKRRGRPDGRWFGYRLLSYAEAKALIYVPSYLHVLQVLESSLVEKLQELGSQEEVALVDVSFQPDSLGPRPISHAALLADYLNGKLAPYQAAQQRLRAGAEQLAALHAESARRVEQGLPDGSVLEQMADQVCERAKRVQLTPLTSYAGCAALFEQQGWLLTLVRNTGSGDDIEAASRVLDEWVRCGVLSLKQARELSMLAPVCRWSDDWWRPGAT